LEAYEYAVLVNGKIKLDSKAHVFLGTTLLVHSGDQEGQNNVIQKSASNFLDNDMAVLVTEEEVQMSFKINPKFFQKVAMGFFLFF